jgi:hypothetical protein
MSKNQQHFIHYIGYKKDFLKIVIFILNKITILIINKKIIKKNYLFCLFIKS